MGNLFVARRKHRRGLLLSPPGKSNLLFPLDGVDRSELDELVRGFLSKRGITDEAMIQAVVDQAEQSSEARIKVWEVKREVRRLMALKAQGLKLMSVGFRKWREAFYRPIIKTKTYKATNWGCQSVKEE